LALTGMVGANTATAVTASAPPRDALPAIELSGVAGKGKTMTGAPTLEGGVTDGTYWYAVGRSKDSNGRATSRLLKTKLYSERATTIRTYRPRGEASNLLGHGNDLAYNSTTNRLLIPAWDNDSSTQVKNQSRLIRVVDPKTLAVVDTKTAPDNLSSLCYDAEHNRYVGGSGLQKLWTADSSLHKTGGKELGLPGTSQGIDCDANYVYVLGTPKSDQRGSRIYVLTWNLDVVRTYSYQADASKPDEVEHLTNQRGTFYLGFNDKTGSLNRLDKFVYRVGYRPGGGTGSMTPTTVLYGKRTHLRANSFTRSGYTFVGWHASRTADGKVRYQNPRDRSETKWAPAGDEPSGWVRFIYPDQASVYHSTPRGAMMLTAVWQKA